MSLKFPARLIELFTMYRRLNSILDENWRDASSKEFFSNFVDPVNSGWKQFHQQTDEATHTIKQLEGMTQNEEHHLRQVSDEIASIVNGAGVRQYGHCRVHLSNSIIDLLVPPNEIHLLATEQGRLNYAMKRVPEADEHVNIEYLGNVSV